MTIPLLIQTGVFDPTLASRLEGANRSLLARRRNARPASRRRLTPLAVLARTEDSLTQEQDCERQRTTRTTPEGSNQ